MAVYSPSVEALIAELSKMPGIGRKSAQRIAFYLLKISKDEAFSLARAITDVKEKVSFCSVCGVGFQLILFSLIDKLLQL